jgi:hypothetical protein
MAHGDAYGHASAPVQSVPSTGVEAGQPGPVSIGGGVVSGGGGAVSGGGGDVSMGGGVVSGGGGVVSSGGGEESEIDESIGGGGVESPSSATAVAEICPPHATSAHADASPIAPIAIARRARIRRG